MLLLILTVLLFYLSTIRGAYQESQFVGSVFYITIGRRQAHRIKKTMFGWADLSYFEISPTSIFSSLEGFLLPAGSDFYLHIPYKGWMGNPLKKSPSLHGSFASRK